MEEFGVYVHALMDDCVIVFVVTVSIQHSSVGTRHWGLLENRTEQSSQMLTTAPPLGTDSRPSSLFSIRTQGITRSGKDNLSLAP